MHFNDRLKQYQHRIQSVLKAQLPLAKNNLLHEAIRYSVLNGGKRLRPILVYLTGETFNASLEALDTPAFAIELIHCYSLIHDDLPAMDNDDMRRGKPTCHKKFNDAIAVLAGDALQALAFQKLSQANPLFNTSQQCKMQLTLARANLEMVEGQTIDITTNTDITPDQLLGMYQKKTGALFEASIALGAIAANCQDETIFNQLIDFAKCLGVAFQIQDDVFDHASETISTYTQLVGLNTAQEKINELFEQATQFLTNIRLSVSPLAELTRYISARKH